MPNARTADARAGWELYRAAGFSAELDDINDKLDAAGHRTVSPRTYSHYRNLAAAGYSRYISINRFDVARAARPYESAGASSRYSYLRSSAGVQVTFPRGRKLIEAVGRVTRVGDTGVVIIFDRPKTFAALVGNRPRIGENAGLDFIEPHHHVNGRIIEFDVGDTSVQLEVEFTRLQSVSEYVGATELPSIQVDIQLSESGAMSDSIDVVGRQLYYVFELLEAARALSNEADRFAGSHKYSAVIRVVRLRRESPLLIGIVTSAIVVAIAKPALMLLELAHKYHSIKQQKYASDEQEALAEIARSKVAFEKKKSEVQIQVLEVIQNQVNGLSEADLVKLENIAERDLLANVESLSEQAVNDATLTTPDDETDLPPIALPLIISDLRPVEA
jgi:hypothetical protein